MISIKLDTQAVLSLFPEGSEARLALQGAVIKNVVESVVGKKVSSDVSETIYRVVESSLPSDVVLKKIVEEKFKDFVQRKFGWSDELNSNYSGIKKLADKVKSSVELECDDVITKIVSDATTKASESLHNDEEALIQRVSDRITRIARESIAAQLNKDFPDIINDAIKARLFPASEAN